MTWTFTQTDPIPSYTFSGDVLYSSAAVAPDGQTVFIARETTYADTGTFSVAVLHSGTWSVQAIQPSNSVLANERLIYYAILPTGGASGCAGYVFGSQAATWGELGWLTPQGSSGVENTYSYNALKGYFSSDWRSVAPTEFTVKEFTSQPSASATYGGTTQTWHYNLQLPINSAVLGSDGSVYVCSKYTDCPAPDDAQFNAWYSKVTGTTAVGGIASGIYTYSADGMQYILDGAGVPWAICSSGTTLWVFPCDSGGAPTATGVSTLSLSSGTDGILWFAGPNSGTALSDSVDLAYTSGQSQLSWVRVTKSGSTWTKTTEEVIATGLSSNTFGSNGWSHTKIRLTRTPDGTLYATGCKDVGNVVVAVPGDPDNDVVVYQRTGTNTWTTIYEVSGGREPACVLNGGNGVLYLESTPGGTTTAYTSGTSGSPPSHPRRRVTMLVTN